MARKYFFISCLIILLIAISAVSAEDVNVTSKDSTTDNLQMTGGDVLTQTRTVTGNTFSDIQNTLKSAGDGDIIELSGTFTGSGNAISIEKAVTIAGKNDATLDAKGLSGIIEIQTKNVIIKDIKFINSKETAINANMKYFEVRNCNFEDCNGMYSGAISAYDALIVDSKFTNCTSGGNGAIFGGSIENCTFILCNAHNSGRGVVDGDNVVNSTFIDCYSDSFASIVEEYTPCENCLFINCSSDYKIVEKAKGSIFMACSGDFGNYIENCTILSRVDELSKYDVRNYYNGEKYVSTFIVNANDFEDIQRAVNQATKGDIIWLQGTYTGDEKIIIYTPDLIIEGNNAVLDSKSTIFECQIPITIRNLVFENTQDTAVKFGRDATIVNSKFTNCYGYGGAAISGYLTKNIKAINCTFESCSGVEGGAVFAIDLIANSTFIRCHATEGGAVDECELVSNCTFIKCTANVGGAVYSEFGRIVETSTFKDCSAKYGGAIADCDVSYSTFTNCVATKNDAGAIYYQDEYYKATSCIFTDCGSAIKGGKAYYCIFKGNSKPEPTKTILYRHASITLSQSGTYYLDKTLKVKLTDTDSNVAISGEKIRVTFSNGKSATLTTNSKGIATYSIPYVPGKYTATATVSGNDKINCSKKTLSDISILKAPSKITAKKLTTAYKANNKFNVKLTNSKTGKAISGVKLTVKVYTGKKFKTQTLTTNAKGAVSLQTSELSLGTHKVVISSQDKGLSLKAKTTYIVVKKNAVKISASNTLFKISGYSIKGKKVVLKDKASKKALSNVKVQFKIFTSGKKYKTFTVKTGSNGACGVYAGKLGAGTHKLVISSKERNVKFSMRTKILVEKVKINGAYRNIILSAGKLRFV